MLWLDGRLTEGPTPFDLADRGLTLGDGVFDTALALNGRVVFAEAHRSRLAASAAALGFGLDPERIGQAMTALAAAAGEGALAIRTTATRGSGPRGLKPPAEPRPTLFASAAALGPGLFFAPLRLRPTEIARNETSPASRLKTLGYLDAVLAAGEAAAHGFDEALFCNTRGRVACAGTGNLFALFGDRLVTPPLADGVLAGIVRSELQQLAPGLGLVPEERSLTLPELMGADSVFLTNSLRLVAPVAAIGERAFASAACTAFAGLRDAVRRRIADACGTSP
ncbi:aminotransferase class IV [Methylobacterium segetis]|uniref:aminotransferase class IV n=1 Tax=Methylobacterium segetis TaxID=2488750 RepID=UPI0010539890|nr:aminotransferase class IV [Methylobacterium segetis]